MLESTDAAIAWGRRILEGERVRLRGMRTADLDTLVDWWLDPGQMVPQSGRAVPNSEPGARDMMQKWFANDGTSVGLVIDNHDGVLVGSIGLTEVDHAHRSATLAITIGEPFWGQGYGTDAVRTLTNFAFAELGLHRVELTVWAFNPRGVAAYTRAGFVEEGRKRAFGFHGGEWHDLILMSVLDNEWQQ